MSEAAPAVPNGFERWEDDRRLRVTAWTGACIAASSQFLYVVDTGLVALSLPAIQQDFPGTSRATVGWVAGAFLVAQSSLLLVGGRLGDRYGRKRFFLFGTAVFTLGALATAVAPTVWALIAARALQGGGAAFMTSGALAIALRMFPVHRAAVVIGMWGGIGSVAAWSTPTLGALLVEQSWRAAFLLVVPIGVVAWFVGRSVLVEPANDERGAPADPLGFIVTPVALGLLMLVLSRGGQWGWSSHLTLIFAAAAGVALALFAWHTTVAAAPMLDLDIVRNRWFAANTIAGSLSQMAYNGYYLTAPLVMSGLWGWSIREIGLALAVGQITASIGSPLGGQLVVRYGPVVPMVVGVCSNAAGMLWLTVTLSEHVDIWVDFLPMALLFGFGSGMAGTVTTGAALSTLPVSALGAGNSVQQLVRRMGGALGVAFGVALLGEANGAGLVEGARRTWIFVAAMNLAMLVPVLSARRSAPDHPRHHRGRS